MTSSTTFTFEDLVFSTNTNLTIPTSTLHSSLDDLIADIEAPFSFSPLLDFSSSHDSWQSSITFHFSALSSLSISRSTSLFHSFHLGQLLHEEEQRLLRHQAPTLSRCRRYRRKIHSLFKQAVNHLSGHASNRYYAASRVFALYSVIDPQAIQVAQFITPSRLQRLTKKDFTTLYRHALSLGQASPAYPYHLSLFIGTTEL